MTRKKERRIPTEDVEAEIDAAASALSRPQLVEPERFELLVEGDKIIDAKVELGYMHRGIEKLFTTKTYMQNLALAERICGICSGVHTLCYAQTVEELMKIEVPERAKYLRCVYMELERLHSLSLIHI